MNLIGKWIAVLPLLAGSACAYEYPLQFTPGSGARGLAVAGYQIVGSTVTGTCSYYTVTSGSGKGGGYKSTTTYYNQTCTWDLSGNLLSVAQGAPVAPPPLYTIGTKTVYAASGGITAGTDSALLPELGFVDTPGPHYTWGAFTQPGSALQTIQVTLTSDGDMPLDITAVTESTAVARSHLVSDNCIGILAPGATCSMSILYNSLLLASPTGLAYETLTVNVTSNSLQTQPFVSTFTIRVRVGNND